MLIKQRYLNLVNVYLNDNFLRNNTEIKEMIAFIEC
jgi:hypothetical protein